MRASSASLHRALTLPEERALRRALCLIRPEPHYRSDAFTSGLRAVGFEVLPFHDPRPSDLLVIWNRYGDGGDRATRFERAGAPVVVVENGYLGHHYNAHAKPYTAGGAQLYAIALSNHNGAGRWAVAEAGRWQQQGITVHPWRHAGEHILILPQRGIGPAGVAMPRDWPQTASRAVRAATARPVRVRDHPGNHPAVVPLQDDLAGCWAAVTWGSGAALKAICAGVPVFHGFDRWIGAPAALPLAGADLERPLRCDVQRERMLDRLAWAQWTVPEIASGAPFRLLLEGVAR